MNKLYRHKKNYWKWQIQKIAKMKIKQKNVKIKTNINKY